MDPPDSGRGPILASISNALVHLHTERYGKGPTTAKTFLVDDMIVSLLRDGFTTLEETLIAEGKEALVRELRRSFQTSLRDQFSQVVEDATGREVTAYLTEIHVDPPLAVEIFILAPLEATEDPTPRQ